MVTANDDDRRKRPAWLIPAAVAAVIILIIGAIVVTRDDDDDKTATPGQGEIFLQPIGDTGPDPFGPSVAAASPSSTVPANTPVTLPAKVGSPPRTAPVFPQSSATTTGAITSLSGGTPGLYGGTLNQQSCDKKQLIDFLEANPDKGAAWAAAQGIPVDSLAGYIERLTPVLLRSDTRVTNHGFSNGRATPLQSVLQAGTAVLVDAYGVPRARCACGNPLLPPQAVPTTPTYTGPQWPGFTPGNVTVINKSTTVINVITIIDVETGQPFGRTTGRKPGPDITTGRSPTTIPPFTVPPATTGPTTTTGGSGVFTLVEAVHTVDELRDNWTVDDRAGTATISLPPSRGDYVWTVPQTIDPAGTKIEWGGTSQGNINVLISPRQSGGIEFNTTDLEVSVTNSSGKKSATITVPTAVNEVSLIYGMGFSVTAIYTYRR